MARRHRPQGSPPSETRTAAEILDEVGVALRETEQIVTDIGSSGAERHRAQLIQLAHAGYAVTQSLARLKRRVAGFDGWYEQKRSEWQSDPLLAFFKRVREERTHEARTPRGAYSVEIKNFHTGRLGEIAPPGARGYVIDMQGRPTWTVQGPDGSLRPVPGGVPRGASVKASFVPESFPDSHLGQPIAGRSLAEICDLYVAYLRRLISEANAKFRGMGPPR